VQFLLPEANHPNDNDKHDQNGHDSAHATGNKGNLELTWLEPDFTPFALNRNHL